jgi:chromosomal replication initiation ATPase DnaA
LPIYEFPEDSFSFSELFIPTKENFSYSYILNFFVAAHDPVFLYGPTGTGKTSILQQVAKK